MSITAFDTLAFTEELTAAGVPENRQKPRLRHYQKLLPKDYPQSRILKTCAVI